ncbi:MAG: NUDIX hydrolase [Clostridiales bacterium]|jgi:ADP-ribose pyrophosphatase|nr:NUDIX hydrolase [Clostridiales bacterium]
MSFNEKTIKSEVKFKGNIITLRVDTVLLPDGSEATREIVEHPGGVAVLPVDGDGIVYLVRQYRTPFDGTTLEAPAGKLAAGEDPRDCGVRELREETGLTAGSVVSLGHILPTPGYTNEVIYLYLARELTEGSPFPDEDEFVAVEKYPIGDVVKMCLNGKISDAKTVAAVLRARQVI